MLISRNKKFIKTSFDNEEELERVVADNYEDIFGSNSIYLPKKKIIKTSDGVRTIPDGYAIDIESKSWYIVEAELIRHNVWGHIAPQVHKQLAAVRQPSSRKTLVELAVAQFERDPATKEKFAELGISDIHVRREISEIVEKEPMVGIPIDDVSGDLEDWAHTLKSSVRLWIVRKFVDVNDFKNVMYEFPEGTKPKLDTEEEGEMKPSGRKINWYYVTLADLLGAGLLKPNEKVSVVCTNKRGVGRTYTATILKDGTVRMLNEIFDSPSYAALAAYRRAGSKRKSVNGWVTLKTSKGVPLAEIREKFLSKRNRHR